MNPCKTTERTLDPDGISNWIRWGTILLVILSILGPVLPGIHLLNWTLFPFRLVLPIYIVALIASATYNKFYRIQIPHITLPLLGFIGFAALTTLYTSVDSIGIRGIGLFLTNLVLLIGIILTLNTRRWIYRCWIALIALALVAFGVVVIELLTGWHASTSFIHRLPNRPPYDTWATAWFTNVNNLSFFIHHATVPALILVIFSKIDQNTKFLLGGIWVIGIFLSVHLDARAIVMAYFVTNLIVICLFKSFWVRTLFRRIPTRVGKVIFPISGLSVAAVFVTVSNPITLEESSLWVRWQLQKASVTVGGLYGNGLGGTMPAIRDTPIPTSDIATPHSWFGAIVGDTGLIGLTLFLAFYGGLVIKLLHESENADPIQIISTTSIIVLPIAGLGPSHVFFMPMFWIVLGLSIATLQPTVE